MIALNQSWTYNGILKQEGVYSMTVKTDIKGNSGYSNSGDSNSGYRNSGDSNSGDSNSGHWNSGYSNSGNWNSGHRNSGHWNSGYWNSGNRNSGHFNTDVPSTIRVFGKKVEKSVYNQADKPLFLYFNLTEVVNGELVTYGYKEAFKKSYDNATQDDRDKIYNIPNFDADMFLEISGIDVRRDNEAELKKRAMLDNIKELEQQVQELKKQAGEL